MAFSFVPVGTILPFGGATAPSGWLLCDGSSVSQTAYPALFTAIGVLWGNPGGGSFNLPDGRGAFFRGAGTSGVHVGPGTVGAVQTHATAKNGLSASAASSLISGTAAGQSLGASNIPVLEGQGDNRALDNSQVGPYGNVLFPQGEWGGRTNGRGSFVVNIGHSHGASSVTGTADAQAITIGAGDSETRPNSKGVQYIIKI